jgi:hypothetical protein
VEREERGDGRERGGEERVRGARARRFSAGAPRAPAQPGDDHERGRREEKAQVLQAARGAEGEPDGRGARERRAFRVAQREAEDQRAARGLREIHRRERSVAEHEGIRRAEEERQQRGAPPARAMRERARARGREPEERKRAQAPAEERLGVGGRVFLRRRHEAREEQRQRPVEEAALPAPAFLDGDPPRAQIGELVVGRRHRAHQRDGPRGLQAEQESGEDPRRARAAPRSGLALHAQRPTAAKTSISSTSQRPPRSARKRR